jgi:hypothetical protein
VIISCYHGDPGRPQPCPSKCPVQEWPRIMFRPALLRRNGWVLRRKYRGMSGPATPGVPSDGWIEGDGTGHALPPFDCECGHEWEDDSE